MNGCFWDPRLELELSLNSLWGALHVTGVERLLEEARYMSWVQKTEAKKAK